MVKLTNVCVLNSQRTNNNRRITAIECGRGTWTLWSVYVHATHNSMLSQTSPVTQDSMVSPTFSVTHHSMETPTFPVTHNSLSALFQSHRKPEKVRNHQRRWRWSLRGAEKPVSTHHVHTFPQRLVFCCGQVGNLLVTPNMNVIMCFLQYNCRFRLKVCGLQSISEKQQPAAHVSRAISSLPRTRFVQYFSHSSLFSFFANSKPPS